MVIFRRVRVEASLETNSKSLVVANGGQVEDLKSLKKVMSMLHHAVLSSVLCAKSLAT